MGSVSLYPATHSVDPEERRKVLERALPIKIGRETWV